MLVVEKKWPNFKEGAYAVVFFTSDGLATKLFRRRTDVSEQHVKNVFASEVSAYTFAGANKNISNLVPKFYGCVSVSKVVGVSGEDLSGQFFLELAYQMQHVSGEFVKLGSIPNKNYELIIKLFKEAGIHHVIDASVVITNDEISCVIDFATEEYELEHSPL